MSDTLLILCHLEDSKTELRDELRSSVSSHKQATERQAVKLACNAAAIKDSGWILRKMHNVKLKACLKEVVPGEEHQILRGMTKEALRAKLTTVIGLVHTLTGFQALLLKSDVWTPSTGNPFFILGF